MRLLRIAVVSITAAIGLVLTAPDLLLPWQHFGSLGFELKLNGTIMKIYPGMPAEKAGLKVGDVVDLAATDPTTRRSMRRLTPVWPGVARTLPIETRAGDRVVTLVAAPFPRKIEDNLTNAFLIISQVAFILIGAALLLIRPSLLTWAFYLYALSVTGDAILPLEATPDSWSTAYMIYFVVNAALGIFGFTTFALIFPRDRPEGWRKRIFPYLVAYGALAIVMAIWAAIAARFGDPVAAVPYQGLSAAMAGIGYAIGIGLFCVGYVGAAASDRPRLQWVMLGFIVGFGGYLGLFVVAGMPMVEVVPPVWGINVLQSFNVFVPLTVAYAIARHRVIDVRFFLSRALVYGLLTTVAIGILALLDWAVARQLEASHLGLAVEVAGALAIGIGIHRMHKVIDHIVDRFVFRSVHDAEQHLEKIGGAMMFAQSVGAIDGLLCDESARALRLTAVAAFRETPDGSYRRFASTGWSESDTNRYERDDRLVLRLHAARASMDTVAGDLAVPLALRHRMFGFVVFGAHTDGSAIDPNERGILERFVHQAAVAYDHLISEERAAENTRLLVENEVLRSLVKT